MSVNLSIEVHKNQHNALVITFPEVVSTQISPPTSLIVWVDDSEVPPAHSDN